MLSVNLEGMGINMSQCTQILKHLQEGKPITPLEALNLFGVFRLAARISNLREQGHEIITGKMKSGGKEFASYYIPQQPPVIDVNEDQIS